MEKLGKFPILNCKAPEVKPVAVFLEEDGNLVEGDSFCSVMQGFPELTTERTADGVKIVCTEDCRERKTE